MNCFKKIYYKWQDLDQDILMLVSQIYSSEWFPDYIVGVKRGGLVPAIKLSHILDKPLLILNCQLRDGLNSNLNIDEIPKNKNILIVDDICDSGETFERIHQSLEYSKEIKFCALFNNIRQKFSTNYKARKIDREKDNSWIVFPWEI